jgi:hypothetical protein
MDYCKKLNEALDARDKSSSKKEDQNAKIQEIKEYCVAASILVITRDLNQHDKHILHKLGDEIYAKWDDERGDDDKVLSPFRNDHIRVTTLANMEFDYKAKAFLLQFYKDCQKKDGIFKCYEKLVSNLISYYKKMMEDQPKTNDQENDNYSPLYEEKTDENYELYKNILKAFEKNNFFYLLKT